MDGAQQIGDIGARLNLLMREGTTFGPVYTSLRGPAQRPIDLTDALVRGVIKRRASDKTPLLELQVEVLAPLAGRVAFGLSAAQTRLLAVERRYDPLTLLWELTLTDSVGYVRCLLYGEVTLHLSVGNGG